MYCNRLEEEEEERRRAATATNDVTNSTASTSDNMAGADQQFLKLMNVVSKLYGWPVVQDPYSLELRRLLSKCTPVMYLLYDFSCSVGSSR